MILRQPGITLENMLILACTQDLSSAQADEMEEVLNRVVEG